MRELTIFLLLYCIAFIVPLFAPGRRTLILLGLVVGVPLAGFIGLALWEVEHATGNVVGLIMLLVPVMNTGLGFVSGVITRAVLLKQGRSWRGHPLRNLAIVLGGFATPLATIAWYPLHTAWINRLPDDECLMRKHPLTIAGVTYYLPSIPSIEFVLRDYPGNSNHVSFHSNDRIRNYCRLGEKNRGVALNATSLSLNMNVTGSSQHDKWRRYCTTTSGLLAELLCNRNRADVHRPQLRSINLFLPDIPSQDQVFSEHYQKQLALLAQMPGSPQDRNITREQVGLFERFHVDGTTWWVARPGSWANEADEPFAFMCHEWIKGSGPADCSTSYRLRSGAQLTYQFFADAEKAGGAAADIDRAVHTILEELATSSGASSLR